MTTRLSGKVGEILVNDESLEDFTNGELEYGSNPEQFFAKSGAGAAETIAGAESGQGSFDCVIDADDPLTGKFRTGDLVTLIFRHTATGNIDATGSARLGKPKFTMDRSGGPQKQTWPFVTHGVWTFPGES